MRMKKACECGNNCGHIDHQDGEIHCCKCQKPNGEATHEDYVLDKLDDIAMFLFELKTAMVPFIRQNIDPEDLDEFEFNLLFGEEEDDEDEERGTPENINKPN